MKPHPHPSFYVFFLLQTVTEKHKMNVPETMNEVLDMSDDEGKKEISEFSYETVLFSCKVFFVLFIYILFLTFFI